MKFGIEILILLLCLMFIGAEQIRHSPQNVIKFADSCVWSTVGGNFTSAKQTCNDDGGVIFTFNKTSDALAMLDQLNISYATPVFIGAIRIRNNGTSSFDWLSRPETWSSDVVVDTSAEVDYGYHSDIICVSLLQMLLSLANCSEIMPVTVCEYDSLLNCSVSNTITVMEMREEIDSANSASDEPETPKDGRKKNASTLIARVCPTAGGEDQEINVTCPLEPSQATAADKTEQGSASPLEHPAESTIVDGVDLKGGELMILPSENGYRITNFSSLLSEIVEKSNISKSSDQSPVPSGPVIVSAPNMPGNSTKKHSNITNGTLVREVQFQVANKDNIFSGGVQVSGLNSGSVQPFSPLLIDLHVQKTPQLVNTSRILNSLKQQEHVDNGTLMVFADTVESTAVDRHISDESDELKKDLFSDILSVGESLVKKLPASSASMTVKTEKMVLFSRIMKDDLSDSKVLVEVDHPDTDTHIQLSKLVLECDDDEDVRVSTIAYKKMETFIKASNKHLSSSVVSVTVQYIKGNTTKKGKTRTGLNSVIRFEMKTDIDKGKQEDKRLCTFWDFSERKWSSAGCTVVAKNFSHTTCECNHLTNFAILVMYIETENISLQNQQALFTLTTVGCSLSIACLAMTLICYIYLKMLCKEKIMIHANLSIALLLGQIVFVASGDAHNDPIACKTIAVLLHFLFMASFTWMMVEGIALYLCCTKGIFHHRDMRAKYFLFGWGLPLIIVVISLAARFPDYGSGPQYSCWLSLRHGLIWAFLGPMIVIVVLNIGVMGLVVKCFLTLQANSEKTEVARLRGSLRAMMTLLPLLGVTWILSLLVPFSVVFHYFFVIFNTLQGMCIFFLHCICNEERGAAARRVSVTDLAYPAHLAAYSGDLEHLKSLIEKGVSNINEQDEKGSTAAHKAAAQGHVHILQWLMEAGADTTLRNAQGKTALNVAQKYGNRTCVKVLGGNPDDLDHLEDWSDEEALGTEGNTDGASLSLSAKQKKEARGRARRKVEDLERLLEIAKRNYTQLGGTLPEDRKRLQTIRDKDKTINELEAQLDYERLRREKLEAQLDQYRRDMADLSYRLQSRMAEDSGSDYDADYVSRPSRRQQTTSLTKKRSGSKKRSQDDGGVFIRRNVTKDKRGSRYHKVV